VSVRVGVAVRVGVGVGEIHTASPTIIPLEYCFNPEELTFANPVNFASTLHPAIV
jgi:hypothetical protein